MEVGALAPTGQPRGYAKKGRIAPALPVYFDGGSQNYARNLRYRAPMPTSAPPSSISVAPPSGTLVTAEVAGRREAANGLAANLRHIAERDGRAVEMVRRPPTAPACPTSAPVEDHVLIARRAGVVRDITQRFLIQVECAGRRHVRAVYAVPAGDHRREEREVVRRIVAGRRRHERIVLAAVSDPDQIQQISGCIDRDVNRGRLGRTRADAHEQNRYH